MNAPQTLSAPQPDTATRREQAEILLAFGLATTQLCHTVLTVSPTALAMGASVLANLILLKTFLERRSSERFSQLQSLAPPSNEKLDLLRQKAAVFGKTLGMPRLPEIRVWTNKNDKGFCSLPRLTKPDMILFDEMSLKTLPDDSLEGILAHEMAHLRKHHEGIDSALFFMTVLPVLSGDLLGGWALAAYSFGARAQEFQADRIGALVSRQTLAMRNLFSTEKQRSIGVKKAFWAEASLLEKRHIAATSVFAMGKYLWLSSHPSDGSRKERFETLRNPDVPTKSLRTATRDWFFQFVP